MKVIHVVIRQKRIVKNKARCREELMYKFKQCPRFMLPKPIEFREDWFQESVSMKVLLIKTRIGETRKKAKFLSVCLQKVKQYNSRYGERPNFPLVRVSLYAKERIDVQREG